MRRVSGENMSERPKRKCAKRTSTAGRRLWAALGRPCLARGTSVFVSPACRRGEMSAGGCDSVSTAMIRAHQAESGSAFLVAVADAIEGLDLVETVVHGPQFLPHPFDVAVDGAVIHVNMLAISGVHELVAAFHEPRALRKRLEDQKLRDREIDGTGFPAAEVPARIEQEIAPRDDRLAVRPLAGGILELAPAQQRADALDEQ